MKNARFVIPAQAGIHLRVGAAFARTTEVFRLDPRLRGDDGVFG